MGKLEGKVAVITGGSSGMALASAKLFVEEGAYVFITGRRQEQLDEAAKAIGRNVTGVKGDAANLDDLDRLFDVTEWRMQKAMPLLEQRDKKLIDVARLVGYESDAAFSKAFKRVVGANPGEYLKRSF